MKNISHELNLRSTRTLAFTKAYREELYPHKVHPAKLFGFITSEVNQNGWKYSGEVLKKFFENYKSIFLDGSLRSEARAELTLSNLAGQVVYCDMLSHKDIVRVYIEVDMFDNAAGRLYSTLAENQKWLESHCFTLSGIGKVENDDSVKELVDMRLYIDENEYI